VKSVITEIDELILRITEDQKMQKKVEEPLSINIFTTSTDGGKSTTELNGEFVFFQLLIDCLLRLKYTQKDKNELINLCKTEYEGNHTELNNLRQFKEEYLSYNVLWWYTRETFFYKTLNAALRTQNIHMLFLFRNFILDIQRQLQNNQVKNPLQVYRSQLISTDELDGLKQNIGQFISINSFFSTSKDRATALFFLGDTSSRIDLKLVGVLFEIDANPEMVNTKPFADISEYSHFTNESEVLFMIGSIFRLKNIYYNDTDNVWIIETNLCSDNEFDLKQVLLHMKQQIGNGETNLQTLGKILWDMGKLDLAEKYLKRLINEYPLNGHLLASLYEDLGKIASQKRDYDMSMQWYRKSLEVKKPVISYSKSNNKQKQTNELMSLLK
jgi:tetratricopeptide (TPR) repeat protein